jgi:hypothetical protein
LGEGAPKDTTHRIEYWISVKIKRAQQATRQRGTRHIGNLRYQCTSHPAGIEKLSESCCRIEWSTHNRVVNVQAHPRAQTPSDGANAKPQRNIIMSGGNQHLVSDKTANR